MWQVQSRPMAPELLVSSGTIRFEDVTFSYDGSRSNRTAGVLRNVTFELPAGKKTAIVGASGSGKSTVLRLISRTYDPDSGRVTIDGQDLRDVSLPSLRHQLGLVPQVPPLPLHLLVSPVPHPLPASTSSGLTLMAPTVPCHPLSLPTGRRPWPGLVL